MTDYEFNFAVTSRHSLRVYAEAETQEQAEAIALVPMKETPIADWNLVDYEDEELVNCGEVE